MSTPYLGEVRIFSFNFVPTGWALCDGQLLLINQNVALFSLLGTTYGGDGRTAFALPNLQGSIPIHVGNGFSQGQSGGEITHTLTVSELPTHAHVVTANASPATTGNPTSAVFAETNSPSYATSANTTMSASSVGSAGGSQAHENRPPFLVLTFGIALQGIFPSPA